MPADPQIVVHREGEGGDGKEKRVGPHVGGRLLEELSFRAHRMEDGPSGEESDRRDDGLDEEDEEDRAREKGARLLFLPLAEADGDDDARAHADEVGEGIGNDDEGEGEVGRVIGGLAEEEREEESVEDGVDGAEEHPDRAGDCDPEKELPDRGRAKKSFVRHRFLGLPSASSLLREASRSKSSRIARWHR